MLMNEILTTEALVIGVIAIVALLIAWLIWGRRGREGRALGSTIDPVPVSYTHLTLPTNREV